MTIQDDTKTTATLVTGASSGIGCALARTFARKGHNLILIARDKARLEQLADELRGETGVRVEVLPQDLSIPGAARTIIDQLAQRALTVDILVNNAGFDVYGNFCETDWTKELQMIQVNLIALTELTKLLLPGMQKRRKGRILNLGSTGSFIPTPLNAVYSATKAYILNFSAALAEELRGSGVTVTTLCPGATRTEFQQRAGITNIALLKFGAMDAEAVAEVGYRAVMSGRRVAIPGLYNKLQVFLSRFLPGSWLTKAAKRMLEPR